MKNLFFALALLFAPSAVAQGAPVLDVNIEHADPLTRLPKLHAFLKAENEALKDEYQERAEMESREAEAGGYPFRPFKLTITHEARFVSDRFASFLREVNSYTGGAHPNLFMDPLTWDVRRGEFVRLDAFLAPDKTGKALVAVSRSLREALLPREGLWEDAVKAATVPDLAVLQAFTLEPSTAAGRVGGIAFHYSPYEVAPYSEGPQRAVVAQSVIAPYLRAEVAGLFGGSPAE